MRCWVGCYTLGQGVHVIAWDVHAMCMTVAMHSVSMVTSLRTSTVKPV